MLLSIILPVYNAEEYISRCLTSLLNQNLDPDDYEILVMDDGSKDRSYAVVQEFSKKNPAIRLHKQKNVGASTTRNNLLEIAQGEYIYFMDADDLIAENALGDLVRLAKNLSLDLICFNTLITSDVTNFKPKPSVEIPDAIDVVNGYELFRKSASLRLEIWWYLVKASLLKENGIKFDQNQFNGDVLFTLNTIVNARRIVHIPEVLHCYYQGEVSIMRNKDLTHQRILVKDFFAMIEEFVEFIEGVQDHSFHPKEKVVDNLEHRKNTFVVFFLAKLIFSDIKAGRAKVYLNKLRKIGAYPVTSPYPSHFSKWKKMAVRILGKEYLLIPAVELYRHLHSLKGSIK